MVLAVVLVAVLTVNVGNLRVGGSVGCLMSGIYVLAVVLVVLLADDVRNLRWWRWLWYLR